MFPLFSWLTTMFIATMLSFVTGMVMMVGGGLWGATWPEDTRTATRIVFAGMGLTSSSAAVVAIVLMLL
jgi:Kef-type K+ transport system membrane component KefB